MLPSRSRLTSWNPDSLLGGAALIRAAGESTDREVRRLDDRCGRLDEARTWQGNAHEAATKMFGRAVVGSSALLDYTKRVASTLDWGSTSTGRARADLLRVADLIDQGELRVSDNWIVLIRPAGMTAEHATALQKQAEAAQLDINGPLLAVGEADGETTRSLLVSRAEQGAEFKVHQMGPPGPPPPAPGDEVPDPSTEAGIHLQDMVREQDMSTTVRETTEATDQRTGNHIKTLSMLDGGKQVITTEGGWPPSLHVLPEGSIQVQQYDKNSNYVSDTLTTEDDDGTQTTSVWWTDGTSVVMTRTPDGKRCGAVTTADGRHATLADAFFADPIPGLVGAGLTGLEKQAEKGIPGLSPRALENIEAGAKFGGPAFGVVAALYDVATAETKHDACVAAWKGGVGLVGGIAFDAAMTVLQPELSPLWAALTSGVVGEGFGRLGGVVGDLACPP